MARARFCTSATGTSSSAPEADFASAPSSGGLWRRVMTRPAGAEHGGRAQDGADVVRVGDLVEHDDRPAGSAAAAISASVGSGSGSVSSSTPWCTVSAPSRRSRSRGQTRSGASWRAASAVCEPVLGVLGHQQARDRALAGLRAPPPPRACRRGARGHRRASPPRGVAGAPSVPLADVWAYRRSWTRSGQVMLVSWSAGVGGSEQARAHPAAFPFDIQGAAHA